MRTLTRDDTTTGASSAPLDGGVRPCAWAHRYSPRGLLHTMRDNQPDAEYDAAIVGGSAHAVALYDERTLDAAVAAERERCAKLCEERATYYDAGDDDRPDSRRAIACKACASVIRGT